MAINHQSQDKCFPLQSNNAHNNPHVRGAHSTHWWVQRRFVAIRNLKLGAVTTVAHHCNCQLSHHELHTLPYMEAAPHCTQEST